MDVGLGLPLPIMVGRGVVGRLVPPLPLPIMVGRGVVGLLVPPLPPLPFLEGAGVGLADG